MEVATNDQPFDSHVIEQQRATIRGLCARIETLEEALEQIEQWGRAYPLKVFPEPDWGAARLLLKAGCMSLDRIAAGCMRHVAEGVAEIARVALEGK